MDRDSDVMLLLDRQQLRRHQGIPTLTVFVGPVGVSIHAWKKWNRVRPVAMPPRNASNSLIASWTAVAIASGGLRTGAIQWFAKATGLSPSEAESRWSICTPHDFSRALEGIPARNDAAVALCRRLLAMEPKVGPTNARLIAESLCAESRDRGESEEVFLANLATLMSSEGCPAILLIPERQNVEPAVRFLGRLLGAAPTLPVAVAIPDDVAESALKQSPEDRWRAVLREGVVKVEGVKREAFLERLETAGVATHELAASLDILVAGGTSPDTVDQFAEAACALTPKASEEEEDHARSSAERFLFGLLESMPQTVGVFQLNQQLEFRHGPRAAEGDLLAADCKLVVEIDGSYYHLNSKDAYRRDRRKDWLFQQHGYRVLRFLAEDVVTRLEEILNTILAALDMCRSDLNQKGQSP
jgi:very-short-patch-repair endonuclease